MTHRRNRDLSTLLDEAHKTIALLSERVAELTKERDHLQLTLDNAEYDPFTGEMLIPESPDLNDCEDFEVKQP